MELLSQRVHAFVISINIAKLPSRMIIPIYTPTSNESLFLFLYILPALGVVKFLDFYQPDSEIWYLNVVLICIFLCRSDLNIFSYVYESLIFPFLWGITHFLMFFSFEIWWFLFRVESLVLYLYCKYNKYPIFSSFASLFI